MSVIIISLVVLVVIFSIVLLCMYVESDTAASWTKQLLDVQEAVNDLNKTIQEHQEYTYSKFEHTLESIKNQSSSKSHKY